MADTIKNVVMDSQGTPTLAGTGISSHPQMLLELGKALSPILDAALQDTDWRQPHTLPDLDTCSILLQAVSLHLERCASLKQIPLLGGVLLNCLHTSGVARKNMRPSMPMPCCKNS